MWRPRRRAPGAVGEEEGLLEGAPRAERRRLAVDPEAREVRVGAGALGRDGGEIEHFVALGVIKNQVRVALAARNGGRRPLPVEERAVLECTGPSSRVGLVCVSASGGLLHTTRAFLDLLNRAADRWLIVSASLSAQEFLKPRDVLRFPAALKPDDSVHSYVPHLVRQAP